jgi:hypothetical protein
MLLKSFKLTQLNPEPKNDQNGTEAAFQFRSMFILPFAVSTVSC